MISPEAAWDRLEAVIERLAPVVVPRREAAGRILGGDLVSRVDVPAGDVSAMDGYVLAEGAAELDEIDVVATLAAGDRPGFDLPAATAARIMTGAPVPTGGERVVPIENTDGGTEKVRIDELSPAGAHVRRRAEVLATGDPLLADGDLLTPGAMGLLATHGYLEVPVVRQPSVAIITTGDEVVPPEADPEPGQLRDSHTDFLTSALAATTSEIRPLGIAPDDDAEIRRRVLEGLRSDVLLLSGGVSMGEFDLVESVLTDAGCRLLFDAVEIQPGKPVVAAVHDDGLVFGLPGNPASAMVCYWLFVRPALRRLQGAHDGFWTGALDATAADEIPPARARDLFLPAQVCFNAGEIQVRARSPRGSHDLAAYARGTALLRIPAHSAPAPAGSSCSILPLGDWLAA